MPFIALNKATDPTVPDDFRINTDKVLYVEASRTGLVGETILHMLGQGSRVIALTDTIGTIASQIGGLTAARRHYLATQPDDGASTVYILPANVSFLRPNLPQSPEFWYVTFVDGSELRIVNPVPPGL